MILIGDDEDNGGGCGNLILKLESFGWSFDLRKAIDFLDLSLGLRLEGPNESDLAKQAGRDGNSSSRGALGEASKRI